MTTTGSSCLRHFEHFICQCYQHGFALRSLVVLYVVNKPLYKCDRHVLPTASLPGPVLHKNSVHCADCYHNSPPSNRHKTWTSVTANRSRLVNIHVTKTVGQGRGRSQGRGVARPGGVAKAGGVVDDVKISLSFSFIIMQNLVAVVWEYVTGPIIFVDVENPLLWIGVVSDRLHCVPIKSGPLEHYQ